MSSFITLVFGRSVLRRSRYHAVGTMLALCLSPGAMECMQARIRALTREVGSVREDLRRETKRRERAVAQVLAM